MTWRASAIIGAQQAGAMVRSAARAIADAVRAWARPRPVVRPYDAPPTVYTDRARAVGYQTGVQVRKLGGFLGPTDAPALYTVAEARAWWEGVQQGMGGA